MSSSTHGLSSKLKLFILNVMFLNDIELVVFHVDYWYSLWCIYSVLGRLVTLKLSHIYELLSWLSRIFMSHLVSPYNFYLLIFLLMDTGEFEPRFWVCANTLGYFSLSFCLLIYIFFNTNSEVDLKIVNSSIILLCYHGKIIN